MSSINKIVGPPRAIVIKSDVVSTTWPTLPELIDVPSNTSIVGHRGNNFPGTVLPRNGHIRLVELSAEHVGPTRIVSLRYHSIRLTTAPAFKALSYTWGPASRRNSIQGIYLTDNLLSALVNLATTCEPQLFWIDALCINQADLDEKPAQIKMMREIYGKAKEVVVWLGDPDAVSVDLMTKICQSEAAHMLTAPGMEYTDEELKRLGLPGFRDPAWRSLISFLARPYFRRVWVLQELVMARSAIVACGRYRFPWSLVQYATNWLREKDLIPILASQISESSQPWKNAPSADLINISLTLEDRRENLFLEELLGASRYLLATDPRDKIIGLLGLVTPDDPVKHEITVDYRQPTADFYRAVTGAIINTHRSLKLLSLVTDRSTSKVEGLPSWVPDYSINVDKSSYRWAHFTSPSRRIAVEWEADTNELHIMGRIVDEVVFVAEQTASPGNDAEDTLTAWFRAAAAHKGADEWAWILSLAAPATDDGNSDVDPDAEAFWRTMLLDGVEAVSPAPAAYRAHFAAIAFDAYLQHKAGDAEWFLRLANIVLWRLYDVLKSDADAERDDLLDILINLARAAHDEGRDVVLPDWVIPKEWVAKNAEGKYSLGPRGERLAFLAMMTRWGGSRFFVTRGGRMGKGPAQMRGGEKILVVEGCEQVFLVNEAEDGMRLVGECYVHGLMRLEEKGEGSAFQRITIV